MKKYIPTEFVFQLATLLIAVIVVHAFYVAVGPDRGESQLRAGTLFFRGYPGFRAGSLFRVDAVGFVNPRLQSLCGVPRTCIVAAGSRAHCRGDANPA